MIAPVPEPRTVDRHGVEPRTITPEYLDEVIGREQLSDPDAAVARMITKISKLRAPKEGETLLDIGSGPGTVTGAFARRGLKAVGLDVVPEFVEYSQATNPGVEFRVGRAEELPFADASFDFVVAESTLEHVDDWRRAVAEAARVTKPGGVLHMTTSNRLWPIQAEIRKFPFFSYLPNQAQRRIYEWAMREKPELVAYTHLPAYHWLTWWQLGGEMRKHGLDPYRWPELMDESDIPARAERYKPAIMALLRSPVPLYSFLPNANDVVARKL